MTKKETLIKPFQLEQKTETINGAKQSDKLFTAIHQHHIHISYKQHHSHSAALTFNPFTHHHPTLTLPPQFRAHFFPQF
jgi:hypothetical protein